MKFEDKYVSDSDKGDDKNKDKKVISNDAFAVGDIIQALIDKIEHTRVNLMQYGR